MKRILLSLALLAALSAPTWAQIFHPVALTDFGASRSSGKIAAPTLKAPERSRVAISLQGQSFKWEIPATILANQVSQDFASDKITALIAVDANVGQRGVVGGWYASDSEKYHALSSSGDTADTKVKTQWYELHGAYMFYAKPSVNAGALVGYLNGHASTDAATSKNGVAVPEVAANGHWIEAALVASVPVGSATMALPAPVLGVTVGRAFNQSSGNKNGTTYGFSLTVPVGTQWSVDLSTWNLSLDHGSTITRAGGGVGFHF
ncbi:MAG TPA: hypothetical protein VGK19_11765 [Capsulimonadaceae bacterium]|jgi:hypothetical protein